MTKGREERINESREESCREDTCHESEDEEYKLEKIFKIIASAVYKLALVFFLVQVLVNKFYCSSLDYFGLILD